MKMTELKVKAKGLGVNPGKMRKADLVHTIQRAEGNFACYGTTEGKCNQEGCCFRDDCLKIVK